MFESIDLANEFKFWRILDYLVIIAVAVVAEIIGATVHPYCRPFEWTDPSIDYEMKKNTFPMYSVVLAVIFIAVVYFIGEILIRKHRGKGRRSVMRHLNGWILAHAYSILLTFAIINISKLYAGRLRPDFIARLAKEHITNETWKQYTPEQLCHAAREGRLSFPSGHAGTIFSGYVTPVLYLLGLFRTLRGGRLWLMVLGMIPLILPITVAISRTHDNRHNFDDILCGSVVGTIISFVVVLVSFKVNYRGEWTLRDHPDCKESFSEEKIEVQQTVIV